MRSSFRGNKVGGVPEIVSNEKEALVVSPPGPCRLAVAIGRILQGAGICAGLISRSLEAIRQKHSPEARARSLMRIYQNALTLKAP